MIIERRYKILAEDPRLKQAIIDNLIHMNSEPTKPTRKLFEGEESFNNRIAEYDQKMVEHGEEDDRTWEIVLNHVRRVYPEFRNDKYSLVGVGTTARKEYIEIKRKIEAIYEEE